MFCFSFIALDLNSTPQFQFHLLRSLPLLRTLYVGGQDKQIFPSDSRVEPPGRRGKNLMIRTLPYRSVSYFRILPELFFLFPITSISMVCWSLPLVFWGSTIRVVGCVKGANNSSTLTKRLIFPSVGFTTVFMVFFVRTGTGVGGIHSKVHYRISYTPSVPSCSSGSATNGYGIWKITTNHCSACHASPRTGTFNFFLPSTSLPHCWLPIVR